MLLLQGERWSIGHKFKVHSGSDSNYATNPDNSRSVSGGRVFVNGVPIAFCSATQKFVMLSVTKPKRAAGVMVMQDMLYVYYLLESLKLKVELPTLLEMDNSRAVGTMNHWSVRGCTYPIDVCRYFLRELKDQGY